MLCSAAIYGGTLHLPERPAARLRRHACASSRSTSSRDPSRLIGRRTKLVWFESPINPTLRCVDIRAVAGGLPRARRAVGHRQHVREPGQPAAARARRRPGDAERDEVPERPQRRDGGRRGGPAGARSTASSTTRRLLGTVLDPHPAYALGARHEDAAVRIARHNANAHGGRRVPRRRPARVSEVLLPGAAVASRSRDRAAQMCGFGGMVTLRPRRQLRARGARCSIGCRLIKRAASLGGVESLCSLPVLTSQCGLHRRGAARAGVTRGMVRLSIGLEDPTT